MSTSPPAFVEENQQYVDDAMMEMEKSMRSLSSRNKPWEDAEGNHTWPSLRVKVASVVRSGAYELCLGTVILCNLLLVIVETDLDARCFPEYASMQLHECPHAGSKITWIRYANLCLLVIYSIEVFARLYVERCQLFCNKWNLLDIGIVMTGWADYGLVQIVNMGFARMFRLIRLARALRLLINVPELYLLISGLYSSFKAIVFGSFLLIAIISLWALIAVQVLHPITSIQDAAQCERCGIGYSSVFQAFVTIFQQIVAGDSWGTISLPLIDAAPWTLALLFLMSMTVSMGVLNLILAVIVERAAEARENDRDKKLQSKYEERSKNIKELAGICGTIDRDQNGFISFSEMETAYDEVEEFTKLMDIMDIKRDEMQTIFRALGDRFGPAQEEQLSYTELVETLSAFQLRDPVMMQSFLKYSVMEVRKILKEEVLCILNQHTSMLKAALPQTPQMPHFTPAAQAAEAVVSPTSSVRSEGVPCERQEEDDLDEASFLQRLQSIHEQIQPLLAQAQEVAMAALDLNLNAATASSGTASWALASRNVGEWSPDAPSSQKLQSDEDAEGPAELQLAQLRASFRDRAKEAERLQRRCRQLAAVPAPSGEAKLPKARKKTSLISRQAGDVVSQVSRMLLQRP